MKKGLWLLVPLLLLLTGCSEKAVESDARKPAAYWPTDEWKTSTPEEQGMESGKLADMLEFADKEGKGDLDGLLVIRNGYIVVEKYNFPYKKMTSHNMYSVTKSITGTLAGIAIDQGALQLDDHVLDFFPEMKFEHMSQAKKKMTVEQLLTMTNGVDWPEWGNDEEVLGEWLKSDHQLQYYLDQPINEEQVGKFNYDTGAAQTVAAILEKQTKMSMSDFAEKNLFQKIGITSAEWKTTKEGSTMGGSYAEMTPRDMARFGYLYLHDGNWDGDQVVPAAWVKASLTAQTSADTDGTNYGYYFWILTDDEDESESYLAMGWNNQFIFLSPKNNLLVVQTSNKFDFDKILDDYIYPSIVSEKPIELDEKANKRLKQLMAE